MVLYVRPGAVAKVLQAVQASTESDFYRQHFARHTAAAVTSLAEIPFLERSDIAETLPDLRRYVPETSVRFVGFTSGTTSGQPLVSYVGDVVNYYFEPSLGQGIVRPLIVYPPLNKNFGASFIQQCRQAKALVTPVFGDYQSLANSAVLAAATRVDALYATPTLALALAPYLKQHYNLGAIKLLAVASESLTNAQMASLRALYPNAALANLYASAEVGQFIMHPCQHIMDAKEPYVHLLTDALVAAELHAGELVVTMNQNPAFPLLRYKTGDQFTVVREQCACGKGMVLELVGREGVDVVRTQGFELRASTLDDFFARLPVTISSYQLHVYPGNVATSVRLVLELIAEPAACDLVQRAFLATFPLTKNLSLEAAIAADVIEAVAVQSVTTLSLQREKRRVLVNHLI